MSLIRKIRASLKQGYYCECHNDTHRKKQSILGLVGAFISASIMGGNASDEELERFIIEENKKKYCVMCEP
jgi:hypothetical protein